MKKVWDWIGIVLLLAFLCLLCSCDCMFGREVCRKCKNDVDNCICYRSNGSSDYFSANTLIGEWQMSGGNDKAYMDGCGLIPKGIVFAEPPYGSFGRCTMTYAIGQDPQWYQIDLAYNYVRRELTFYDTDEYGELEKWFSFTYYGFLFPTLTVQDSFGTYEWRKVRTTTSN